MLVIIRTDASQLIGSGHVMRCLVLADALSKSGHEVIFLCRDLPGNCYSIIRERGYLYFLHPYPPCKKQIYETHLPCDDYSIWLGVSQEEDARETLNFIKNRNVDLMITDIYGLDISWEKVIKPAVKKLMVIDDLANRLHTCDLLLDHNYYQNYECRYDGLVPSYCKKLLGPSYALINPKLGQVKKARQASAPSKHIIENVLVFLGGMDVKNYTEKVLAGILDSALQQTTVEVVLGKANMHNDGIIEKYSRYSNIDFHIQPHNYFDLLTRADLSINAGGVSVLERLFINLPSLIICTAENQKQICHALQADNLGIYVENLAMLPKTINQYIKSSLHIKNANYLFASNPEQNLLKEITDEFENFELPT
ncbi:UDP-2,4-diacetamido-2,4,6-trideoxy-beta-L-altropyranose hydrolase [Legionella sp. 27cVA30]|uniref:UDP-2,4-diacetamido-2,4, 6-trideoxy-beta-L-altropyranose hydrolase n=1 Tax=Legionella sp. 27cVA30 TaxID=2905657 RepID=UPI0020A2209D|nr:UDP-2,4-diacetamido-2,4,6-trideoxy-beta-L-altropyranose hydrolase [Legionella sp. 27cVA30]MCP0914806.1 UDP-2,4-diacetamido-2,4,6-trideoxy-beta-L-altropyranose hydrolase [Legionella sp. 27cVA30]